MPLHIEILYNEYQFAPAFAVASLLALLALVTLLIKSIVEWKAAEQTREFELESVRGEQPVLVPTGAKAA